MAQLQLQFEAISPEDNNPLGSSWENLDWDEVHMEAFLALMPSVLGVTQQLPIGLSGGNNQQRPDQIYCDSIGRVTAVEIKNEEASPDALAQLLAYAINWQALPIAEATVFAREIFRALEGGMMQHLSAQVQVLGELIGKNITDAAADAFLEAVDGESPHPWVDLDVGDVDVWGRSMSGANWLSWIAPPIRMVLVAPSFSEECVAMARSLESRGVHVELCRAALLRSKGSPTKLVLRWANIFSEPMRESTWRAASSIWTNALPHQHFVPNGWADHRTRSSISFASRQVPRVKLWLEFKGEKLRLFTDFSSTWTAGEGGTSFQTRFGRYLDQHGLSGREWEFSLDSDTWEEDLLHTALVVGHALHSIVVPHALTRWG